MEHTARLQPPSANIARALARFTLALSPVALPDDVWRKSTHQILDAIGLAFASRHFPFAAPALAGIAAAGAPGDATTIGGGAGLQPRDAALANGYLIHGLDFDDTHPGSIVHPTVACLPTALAIGEATNATWGDLIAAYAAGMETAIRIGRAVKGGFHHAGFHATGLVSHFSSAVIAGKLLGLSEDQIVSAQGIAASTSAGVQVFLENGAWTKRMHPGWGALAGITAAHLAKADFHGPERAYEGKFGLFDTHMQERAAEVDTESVIEDLGTQWTMMDTAIKPFPVCHFIHGCAEAALDLRAEVANPQDIEAIVCELPAPTMPIVAEPAAAKKVPRSDYEAKFSVQFVVAACLVRGRFTLAELDDASLADPEILAVADKVQCIVERETAFPKYFSGTVSIRLGNDRTLRRSVPVNLGSGERALNLEAIVEKFRANAGLTLPKAEVEAALETLLSAGSDTPVRDVMRVLGRR
nr:MmgE/PrpD family protein [uncultured Cupriavidus sp.]